MRQRWMAPAAILGLLAVTFLSGCGPAIMGAQFAAMDRTRGFSELIVCRCDRAEALKISRAAAEATGYKVRYEHPNGLSASKTSVFVPGDSVSVGLHPNVAGTDISISMISTTRDRLTEFVTALERQAPGRLLKP